jgi:stage III sporulation protein AF
VWNWLLGITSAILITTAVDILMPEGETKKYVKGIASLLIFVAVITPLSTVVDNIKATNINNIQATENQLEDSRYILHVRDAKLRSYENAIKRILRSNGIDGIEVTVVLESESEDEFEFVRIDITHIVIINEYKNINIIKTIKSEVKKIVKVDESRIIIIGNQSGTH